MSVKIFFDVQENMFRKALSGNCGRKRLIPIEENKWNVKREEERTEEK